MVFFVHRRSVVGKVVLRGMGKADWVVVGFRSLVFILIVWGLTQDGTKLSPTTSLLYYNLSYKINKTWSVSGDIFNLLNTKTDDITYYCASRLPGEPAGGVNDFMFNPVEPRTFRLALTARF